MKTAVITTGGLGTRLSTTTKGLPKTMLPLYDKSDDDEPLFRPLIELIFENLYDHGFRNFCIIVATNTKTSILNQMLPDDSFIKLLRKRNSFYDKRFIKTLLKLYKKIDNCEINWINQSSPMGFGHALLAAKKFVKEQNFLLHAGDTYFPNYDFLPEFINMHKKTPDSTCSLLLQHKKILKGFGIAQVARKKNTNIVFDVEEKPKEPKSNLAILPVYIFQPTIFDALKQTESGYNKELQVTDAIKTLINWNQKVIAFKMKKPWFDIGTVEKYHNALNYSYKQSK